MGSSFVFTAGFMKELNIILRMKRLCRVTCCFVEDDTRQARSVQEREMVQWYEAGAGQQKKLQEHRQQSERLRYGNLMSRGSDGRIQAAGEQKRINGEGNEGASPQHWYSTS
jgi:hypothetical protein